MIKQSARKNILFRALAGLGFLLVLALAVLFLDVPCVFKVILGLPCPACGLTRAWVRAFFLDFSGAFYWHPLFWAIPVLFILLVFFDVNKPIVKYSVFTLLGLFLAVWAVRMVLFYPHTPPMDRLV